MASSAAEWTAKLQELGIEESTASNYATKFNTEQMQIDQLVQLGESTLQQLGVDSMGDRVRIDKAIQALKAPTSDSPTNDAAATGSSKSKGVDTI